MLAGGSSGLSTTYSSSLALFQPNLISVIVNVCGVVTFTRLFAMVVNKNNKLFTLLYMTRKKSVSK